MIFYQLHAVLIREKLTVTTDKRGTYIVNPRGVLVLPQPLTVPVVTDVINSEPEARIWKAAVMANFDRDTRTAWTVELTPNERRTLDNSTPGSVSGSIALNLLNEWWLAGFAPTRMAPTDTGELQYEIDHNRQIVTRADKGLTLAGLTTLGWLACWPWLLISPTWEAYEFENA